MAAGHRSSSSPTAFGPLLHTNGSTVSTTAAAVQPLSSPRPPADVPHAKVLLGRWPVAALLDPLDAELCAEILKYGDFAQATYDAYDHRHWSPHCGTCLHGLRRMFPALGLADRGYVATVFIYATCDALTSRGVGVLRVVVRHDVVTLVPSVPRAVLDAPVSAVLGRLWALAGRTLPWLVVHVGDELVIDVAKSPHLKHSYDALGFHNLELCLHLLDGHESAAGEFRQEGSA